MKKNNKQSRRVTQVSVISSAGITLPEMLISVAILGVISSAALPNYMNAVKATKQKDVASQISQIQAAIQGYREEFLINPSGWTELARVTPVATNNGSASGTGFAAVSSSNGGHYEINVKNEDLDVFVISASALNSTPTNRWEIKSCLNTKKGLSDIKLGTASAGAEAPNCS